MSRVAEETDALVNKLHEQVYGSTEENGTEGVDTETNETVETAEGIQADEADQGVKVTDAPQKTEDTDYWKHKFETLQGMYNADIPKLQAHAAFLEGILAEQHAKGAQQDDKSTAAPQVDVEAIDNLKDDYQYILDAIYAVVQSEGLKLRSEIINEVNRIVGGLSGKVDSVGAQTAKASDVLFYNELTQYVPDWAQMNEDKAFLAWLGEEDVLSGYRRYDLLQQARSENNAAKVAKFFNEYKRITGTAGSTVKLQGGGRIVAPGRSTGSVSQTKRQEGDEPLTRADIAKFYSDCKRGLYNGREKERQAMETRIATLAASFGKRG